VGTKVMEEIPERSIVCERFPNCSQRQQRWPSNERYDESPEKNPAIAGFDQAKAAFERKRGTALK